MKIEKKHITRKHIEKIIIKMLKKDLDKEYSIIDNISNDELAMIKTLFLLESIFPDVDILFIDDIFYKEVKTVQDAIELFMDNLND